MLNKIDGPACPECGCCDADAPEPSRGSGWWAPLRTCTHCGHAWSPPQEMDESDSVGTVDEPSNGVVYHRVKCPKCQSKDTEITSTRQPVRYHLCRACQYRFKSVEE